MYHVGLTSCDVQLCACLQDKIHYLARANTSLTFPFHTQIYCPLSAHMNDHDMGGRIAQW